MGFESITDKRSFFTALESTEGPDAPLLVVDCYTTWCPKCKAVAPKIEEIAHEYSSPSSSTSQTVKFYSMDIERAEDVAQEYGIGAVPTFLLFKDGEKVDEVVGPKDEALREKIRQNLS